MNGEDESSYYNQVSVTSLPKLVSRKKPAASPIVSPNNSSSSVNSPSITNQPPQSSTTTTTTTTTSTQIPTTATTGSSTSTLKTPSNTTINNKSPNLVSGPSTPTLSENASPLIVVKSDEKKVNSNNTSPAQINDSPVLSTPPLTTSLLPSNTIINLDDDDVSTPPTLTTTTSTSTTSTITTTTTTTISTTNKNIISIDEDENNNNNNNNNNNLPKLEETFKWDPISQENSELFNKFLENRVKGSFKDSLKPRDHQWKTIVSIIKDLVHPQHNKSFQNGKRYNYLIQHAAGSGKSLTIACLINGKLKFDTIVIMNDRSQLDAQLGDVIIKFLESNGVTNYCRPKSSKQLQREISLGRNRIVITTMQKFAQLLPSSTGSDFSFKSNSVAIISDEAHRSHGKSTTEKLHEFLSGNTRQTNQLTYFSFTCTPTVQCLEMFGVFTKGTNKIPFYTYSMDDAQKDNLVLDVISNFISFKIKGDPYSNITDIDEEYDMEDDEVIQDQILIKEKAIYILNHFIDTKSKHDNGGFKSRGMVVCSGRKNLIIYKRIIDALIQQLPPSEQFDTIAAFSPFQIDGRNIVESDSAINGKYAHYGTDKNRGIIKSLVDDKHCKIRLLIVADKLQTGFDEPTLSIMYVDKKIKGANAVQTLSRLSRTCKDKNQTMIIDFINNEQDIKAVFNQYKFTTSLRDLAEITILSSKFISISRNIKEALSKERNITTFCKSILYHENNQSPKYESICNDIEEYVDIFPRITQEYLSQSAITPNSVFTIKKTLDSLRRQHEQHVQSQLLKSNRGEFYKIRIDYFTDKESQAFIDNQNNIDYDADFATSLWAKSSSNSNNNNIFKNNNDDDDFSSEEEKPKMRNHLNILKELSKNLPIELQVPTSQQNTFQNSLCLPPPTPKTLFSSTSIKPLATATPPPPAFKRENIWSSASRSNINLVGGISTEELNRMETQLLELLEFDVNIRQEEFNEYLYHIDKKGYIEQEIDNQNSDIDEDDEDDTSSNSSGNYRDESTSIAVVYSRIVNFIHPCR
eukprot:gene10262-12586_t